MIEGVRAILYQFLNFMNIKFSKAEEQYDKSSSSLSVRHYFDLMTDIRTPYQPATQGTWGDYGTLPICSVPPAYAKYGVDKELL